MCLADETISDKFDTEYNCLSPVQDEQSDLGSTSGLNAPGDQSQSDTTHGNPTGLHENEEQDTNNQCGHEQKGNEIASQFNECNTDKVLTLILMFWRMSQKQVRIGWVRSVPYQNRSTRSRREQNPW